MTKEQNEFLKGLKFNDGETSQKEIAEESIGRQLFHILSKSKLKNGEVKDIENVVEQISNDLGLQKYRTQIKRYITQLLKNDRYQYGIDANGNIIANYSRLYMVQMAAEQASCEAAEKNLQRYIQLVKKYVKNLEKQDIKVTRESIISQFNAEELRENTGWVDLAIESVTGEQISMKMDCIGTYRDEL